VLLAVELALAPKEKIPEPESKAPEEGGRENRLFVITNWPESLRFKGMSPEGRGSFSVPEPNTIFVCGTLLGEGGRKFKNTVPVA